METKYIKYQIFVFMLSFLLGLSNTAYSKEINWKFKVLDKDRPHIGLRCKVFIIRKNNKPELISKTDLKGEIMSEIKCVFLERILINPESDSYFSKTIDCPIEYDNILISPITYAQVLLLKAQLKKLEGDYGSAALAFSDSSARFRELAKDIRDVSTALSITDFSNLSPELKKANIFKQGIIMWNVADLSKMAATESFIQTGKYFGIADPIYADFKNNQALMSDKLKSAIYSYQLKNGLNADGKLNMMTLRLLTDEKLGEMMFSKPSKSFEFAQDYKFDIEKYNKLLESDQNRR